MTLIPTAVTQTQENSPRVECNSCKDQRLPNSPVTATIQCLCKGTEVVLLKHLTLAVTSVMSGLCKVLELISNPGDQRFVKRGIREMNVCEVNNCLCIRESRLSFHIPTSQEP